MAIDLISAVTESLQVLNAPLDEGLRSAIVAATGKVLPDAWLEFKVDPVCYDCWIEPDRSEDDPGAGVYVLTYNEIESVFSRWRKEHRQEFRKGLFNEFGEAVLGWLADRWAAVGGPAAYPRAYAILFCSCYATPSRS